MQNGAQKTLAERLKEKTEEEHQQVEKIVEKSFRNLSKKLQESSIKELTTIENAIRTKAETASSNLNRHYKILSIAYGKEWIRSAIAALAISFAVAIATWLLLTGLSYHVYSKLDELAKTELLIKQNHRTLKNLEKDTFGIHLQIEKHGRFIVLPEGYTVETKWANGDRKSLRLVKN